MSEAAALELRGIGKAFGSVQALRGADLVLAAGEIHALLGENGAGKSTLLQIADGMLAPDAGSIRVQGSEVVLRSPRDARALRIGMVHQHFTSIGAFTVAESIALATGRRGMQAGHGVTGALSKDLDPAARVESLSVGLRQRLEVIKALATGATILLLDEPSAALAPSEVDELLAQVRQFARDGGAVALVTHKLPEVFAAADRVTVLRNGAVTLHASVEGQTRGSLATAMIGESESRVAGEAAMGAGFAALPNLPSDAFRLGDSVIRAGELVGIAAVEGNGQRELLRKLAGLAEPGATSPPAAAHGSVAFVPEDRSTEGLIPELSLTENLLLGREQDPRWTHGPWIDWGAVRTHAAALIESYSIRATSPDDPAGTLSGGNQQKVVLARALEGRPRVLVAENPTRGLDIRAAAEVHGRLRAAARAGVAVIVYSSDLDEVLELAERVLVVRQGVVLEAPRGSDRRTVGDLMLGIRRE